jgi:hypothetical protein
VPIVVTENGIAADDDANRIEYVSEALLVRRRRPDGVTMGA